MQFSNNQRFYSSLTDCYLDLYVCPCSLARLHSVATRCLLARPPFTVPSLLRHSAVLVLCPCPHASAHGSLCPCLLHSLLLGAQSLYAIPVMYHMFFHTAASASAGSELESGGVGKNRRQKTPRMGEKRRGYPKNGAGEYAKSRGDFPRRFAPRSWRKFCPSQRKSRCDASELLTRRGGIRVEVTPRLLSQGRGSDALRSRHSSTQTNCARVAYVSVSLMTCVMTSETLITAVKWHMYAEPGHRAREEHFTRCRLRHRTPGIVLVNHSNV